MTQRPNMRDTGSGPVDIATFYKFTPLHGHEKLQPQLKREMLRRSIKGTIILAPEGINATIAAETNALQGMLDYLQSLEMIGPLEIKTSQHDTMPFGRARVRAKPEIISVGAPSEPAVCVGEYVAPQEWNALITREDVVTIDTRNDYEYRIGHFKGAINPQTSDFKQMASFTAKRLNPLQHKHVAMYCTGGIRCEKYSSYLLSQGFERVYHLKGGILKYLETIPETRSLWKGACFVFDRRIAVTHGLKHAADITMCYGCGIPLNVEDRPYAECFNYQKCEHCDETRRRAA